MTGILDSAADEPRPSPGLGELFAVWLRIGLLSFGGPAAQIALMHQVIVDERKWLSEVQYLNALSFCMLLPGPEAMQLATYVGWRTHGTLGGLITGLLFVLPGACVIFVLASLYAVFGDVDFVSALFLGVKAAVIVIVIQALLKVAGRALTHVEHWVVAGLAFVAIFFFALPFPLLIVAAGLFGFLRASRAESPLPTALPGVSARSTLKTAITWLVIWWAPLLALLALGSEHLLFQIGLFFSKLAVVTFGGAYAVLAYLGQAVVGDYGWLSAGEMMDGLGLAETTPGPLILVNEFVGFLAAFREGGIAYGALGALVTLWATFAPCFLWIFVGAPYIEWIGSQARLRGALSAITAAVVGVILNLSLWFALHVFFAEVERQQRGPLVVWEPTVESLDWIVVVLTVVCALLTFRWRLGITRVLLIASLGGLALTQVVG